MLKVKRAPSIWTSGALALSTRIVWPDHSELNNALSFIKSLDSSVPASSDTRANDVFFSANIDFSFATVISSAKILLTTGAIGIFEWWVCHASIIMGCSSPFLCISSNSFLNTFFFIFHNSSSIWYFCCAASTCSAKHFSNSRTGFISSLSTVLFLSPEAARIRV